MIWPFPTEPSSSKSHPKSHLGFFRSDDTQRSYSTEISSLFKGYIGDRGLQTSRRGSSSEVPRRDAACDLSVTAHPESRCPGVTEVTAGTETPVIHNNPIMRKRRRNHGYSNELIDKKNVEEYQDSQPPIYRTNVGGRGLKSLNIRVQNWASDASIVFD